MKDSKNQIIRSMKSYDEGGSTDESCGPGDGGRGRSRGKGCHKVTKFGRRSIPEPVKKVAKAAAVIGGGAIAYAKNAFGVKDKVKELMGHKTGGSVKMQKGGGVLTPDGRLKSKKTRDISLSSYGNSTNVSRTKKNGDIVTKSINTSNGYGGTTADKTKTITNKAGETVSKKTKNISAKSADRKINRVINNVGRNANDTYSYKKGGTAKRKMQSGGTASSTFADSERRMASAARPTASGVDNMTTNTTAGQKLNYKSGGTTKRKMQVGGMAKRPTLSARVKPIVKAVKTVKATIKRRG